MSELATSNREGTKLLPKYTEATRRLVSTWFGNNLQETDVQQSNPPVCLQVASQSKTKTRLNEPSLLAANVKPINSTINAKKGRSATERLQDRWSESAEGGPTKKNKRDEAQTFLDELQADVNNI